MTEKLKKQDPTEHPRKLIPEGHVAFETIYITIGNIFRRRFMSTVKEILNELVQKNELIPLEVRHGKRTFRYYPRECIRTVAERLAHMKHLPLSAIDAYLAKTVG